MTSRRCAFALAIASLPAVAHDAGAQPRSPISLEATVGMGFGSTDGDHGQARSGLAVVAVRRGKVVRRGAAIRWWGAGVKEFWDDCPKNSSGTAPGQLALTRGGSR